MSWIFKYENCCAQNIDSYILLSICCLFNYYLLFINCDIRHLVRIYEIYIKKFVTRWVETWEIKKKALWELAHYYDPDNIPEWPFKHLNLTSRHIKLEDLKDINLAFDGKYIVVNDLYREKALPKYLNLYMNKQRNILITFFSKWILMI